MINKILLLFIVLINFINTCSSIPEPTVEGNPTLPISVQMIEKKNSVLRITRLNHATVLIQVGNLNILSDPWFTKTPEYPPGEKLGINIQSLPPINVVISTMDHYDHFDIDGIKESSLKSTLFLVPKGTKHSKKARKLGFSSLIEMEESSTKIIGEVKITAIKATEINDPMDFDFETAWKIESKDWKILLVGHKINPMLAKKIGDIDITILPINNLYVKPILKKLSMSPDEAAEISQIVNAKIGIPYHYMYKSKWTWETFLLSHTGTAQDYAELARSKGVTPILLVPGQTLHIHGMK